jgi:hypothetical protein
MKIGSGGRLSEKESEQEGVEEAAGKKRTFRV